MWSINDTVIHNSYGVCKIIGIEEKKVNQKTKKYFLLKSISEDISTIISIPFDKPNSIRKSLSKIEAVELINSFKKTGIYDIENTNDQRKEFKRLILSGSHREIIKIIKSLYAVMEKLKVNGKKLNMKDQALLDDAERILYNEFSFSLELGQDETLPYIFGIVGR